MTTKAVDVLLVGAGAMSTTLGTLLKQLDPNLEMVMIERLESVAHESTDAMNNAGTGHAAYCELNYTPQSAKQGVNPAKAFNINAAFEVSLQFWSHLVKEGCLPEPEKFINTVPHMSFVWGEENVEFLRERHKLLSESAQFADMEYSEDPDVIKEWMPLIMEGREVDAEAIAATRVPYGSDVNFGSLARNMTSYLESAGNFSLELGTTVESLEKQANGRWLVEVSSASGRASYDAGFVFLGAGGGALPLLQMSGIPEGKGYAGFPVSGQWLVCNNEEIVEKHMAKVYGQAPIGAPPMSVPHLDTRVIDGKKQLLFGPFAGFTTKFLKEGSVLDMFKSIKPNNLKPLLSVGMTSMDLTKYLVSEVMQSHESRVDSLRRFFPDAKSEDWELAYAGQRVQIIKGDPEKGGKLEFGTEVIAAEDGSLAALLGASPGASTAVPTMVNIVENCFAEQAATDEWQQKLKAMIPSYKLSLVEDDELLKKVRDYTLTTLHLG